MCIRQHCNGGLFFEEICCGGVGPLSCIAFDFRAHHYKNQFWVAIDILQLFVVDAIGFYNQ